MSSKYQPPSVYTPFLRRFTDERARDISETIALHAEVRSTFMASAWSSPAALPRLADRIWQEIPEIDLPLPGPLRSALVRCLGEVLALEATFLSCPEIDWGNTVLSLKEQVDLRRFLRAQQHFLANEERVLDVLVERLGTTFAGLLLNVPDLDEPGDGASFSIPLIMVVRDPHLAVDRICGNLTDPDLAEIGLCTAMARRLYENGCAASGLVPDQEHRKPIVSPRDSELPPEALVEAYLRDTPFLELLRCPVAWSVPAETRFEHTHILAGSGHGKTQTLQHLILADLKSPRPPSLVIVDSQGEMIDKLSRLAAFAEPELASKLVIVDPRDVPALNLFDVDFKRLGSYGAMEREQILNGVIELYDYIFGSLLGAELTQKQSVIFRYLARLMLAIPGATIHDLLALLADQAPYQKHIEALPPGARMFFETEFPHKSFADTKRQIQRRLWGILENPTFERMLTAPKNRIDMFGALNAGKVVLVNTAKDFLKAERSSFLGRFFIALTLQAALERAALPDDQRHPAFLYVDEAADYFDSNIDDLLTQARKYRLGVVFSHQYLDQLAPGLRSSIASNTSIKVAGGVSDRDARSMAPDMRTTPTFILEQRKRRRETQFACYVRNLTPTGLSLTVPFGSLEQESAMAGSAYEMLRFENRMRVSVGADDNGAYEAPNGDVFYLLTVAPEAARDGRLTQILHDGRTVPVHVPRGAEEGTRIRIAGQGRTVGDRTGDLYVMLTVREMRESTSPSPASDNDPTGKPSPPSSDSTPRRSDPDSPEQADPSEKW